MSARPHTRPLVVDRPPRLRDRSPRWLAAALALLLTLTLVPATGAIAADLPRFLHADTTLDTGGFSAEPDAGAIARTMNSSHADSDQGTLAEGKSGSGESFATAGNRIAVLVPMGTLLLLLLGAITVMVARRRVDNEEHTL